MEAYSYVIIRDNSPELENERPLIDSKYKKSKKYAMLQKGVHKDGSESINYIEYSSDLKELQERANKFVSWYNYPMNLTKSIQGYITPIN